MARARSAQMGRRNEVTPTQQLRGLVPVIEDWHARMAFLEVCWIGIHTQCSTSNIYIYIILLFSCIFASIIPYP